jgi:hypothetical protein
MDAARYAIDIAAQMTGLESTNEELDALTAKLTGSGKGADHFQQALRQLTGDMDAARAATKAAADALALGQSEYNDLEAAAVQATKAAENAARAISVRDDTAAKAQAAARAVEIYAGKLEALKAAAANAGGVDAEANAAMYEGVGKYQMLIAAADKASRAADKAANKADGLVPDQLTAEAAAANAAVNAYAVTLKKLEETSAGAAAHEQKLGLQLNNVKKLAGHVDKSLSGQSEGIAKMQGALSAMGGPLGALSGRVLGPIKGFADLTQGMGAANAAALAGVVGFAAVAVAVAAITAAVIAGAIALASWGIELADSARSARLSTAAMEAMHPELVGLRSTFEEVSAATGAHIDELQELSGRLREAKVSAEDMPAALRAAAMAEAALGTGGSADFIADIKAGSTSVKVLAADTQRALGGIVAQQMRGLDAQSAKLKKDFNGIFSGLNIEPALSGLQTIVGMFDKTSATGQTMSFFFETIFQPLVDKAETAGYAVEAFVLGFEKSALQLYIGAKPMLRVLGFKSPELTDTLDAAAKAGEIFAVVLTAAAVPVVAIVGAFAALAVAGEAAFLIGISPLIAGFYAFSKFGPVVADAVTGAASAIWSAITTIVSGVVDLVNNPGKWLELGVNMVRGLAQGIAGSAGEVLAAIGGVVTGAIGSAKKLLGIASPSKVTRQLGGFTGEGFTDGLEGEQSAAQDAMADLVAPSPAVLSKADALGGAIDVPASPLAGMPSIEIGAPPKKDEGGSERPKGRKPDEGGGADLSGATFNFYGVKDAEDAASKFGEVLTRILEGDALELGDAVPT